MTYRLSLLLLLGALLAAAAVTSASPMPQSSGDAAPTPAKAVLQKTKPSTVRGTKPEKKTTKVEAAEVTTKKPAEVTTKKPAEVTTKRPEATKTTKTPATQKTTKATKTPATEAPAVARIMTTARPEFTGTEVIPAPICSLFAAASLPSREFRRIYLHGTATCRCRSGKRSTTAVCQVTTLYATVRPGTAAAAHAQEQSSSSSSSPAVLAANIWALRQGCRSRGEAGTVCHFGVFRKENYCDCAESA